MESLISGTHSLAAGRSRAEEWRGLVAAGGTEDKEEACAWLFEWQDGIFALFFYFFSSGKMASFV